MKVKVIERYPHPRLHHVQIQRRNNSRFYQVVARIDGNRPQKTLKTTDLNTAFKLAEDWYRREQRASETGKPLTRLGSDPLMSEVYKSFLDEIDSTAPKRIEYYKQKWSPISTFWRAVKVTEVSKETFKDFYAWRRRIDKVGNHTLHKDAMLIRKVLRHAVEEGHIDQIPVVPKAGLFDHNVRPWLEPEEWKHLQQVSEQRIRKAPNARTRQQRQDAHDQMHFLVHSMMRIDEMDSLCFSACRLKKNGDGQKVLICDVNGKRGFRPGVVARRDAALVYERRLKEAKASGLDETSKIFPHKPIDAFKELFKDANLYIDRATGFKRNRKSLRATAISLFMLENPEISTFWIAQNAGTSVWTIEHFYASRLRPLMQMNALSRVSKKDRSSVFRQAELDKLREAARNHEAELYEWEKEQGDDNRPRRRRRVGH